MPRRERRSVLATEPVGPYTLLRLDRGGLDPGAPGQFFMLEAPGRVLPRALSLCLAPAGELDFLIDPIGPGTEALCTLEAGDSMSAWIYYQVNPTHVGSSDQTAELDDGTIRLVRIPRTVTAFP